MHQQECTSLVKQPMHIRSFPPTLMMPKHRQTDKLAVLFSYPVFVWVPEAVLPERRPICLAGKRIYTPRINEYCQRMVDDVGHRTVLLYCKYQSANGSLTFHSTSHDFLQRLDASVWLYFPYLLTHNSGIPRSLLDIVHEGIISQSGLRQALTGIERWRQNRYMSLRTMFAARLNAIRLKADNYLARSPPTAAGFMTLNRVPGHNSVIEMWLETTSVCIILSEMLIRTLKVKCLLRLDHSRKFPKWLKQYGSDNTKDGLASMKLFLIVQNEIGQITDWKLTRSENIDKSEALLRVCPSSFTARCDEVPSGFHNLLLHVQVP